MSALPRLQTMSFGSLMDATFRIFGAEFGPLAKISILCNLPSLAFGLFVSMLHIDPLTTLKNPWPLVSVSLVSLILVVLSATLVVAATTTLVSHHYLRQPLTVGEAMQRSLRVLPTLISAQISVGIWLFFGFLLFIIPGILWAFSLSLVVPAVVLEGLGAAAALQRSKQLVGHDRSKVVGVEVGLALLVWIVSVAAGAAFGTVNQLVPVGPAQLVVQTGSNLLMCCLQPLYSIGLVLLYYDLRIRKEGFDLELLGTEMEARR